ncbi:MAG TPA: type IV pilin protein [Burkholderiaceae bacterium]|nr:type IV pilin protein [Burkholderiaceae bacterium]
MKQRRIASRKAHHRHGFTLVELVIAMAVLAILAAVAIPNYSAYVLRGARADAQSYLMDLALRQQQHLVDRRSYAATLGDLGAGTVPSSINGKYSVTMAVDNTGAPTFTLTATPQGGQATEACGTMTLTSAGNKTPAKCW